jgi:hypothetical protein
MLLPCGVHTKRFPVCAVPHAQCIYCGKQSNDPGCSSCVMPARSVCEGRTGIAYLDGVVQLAPDELALVDAAFSICQAALQAGQLDLCVHHASA